MDAQNARKRKRSAIACTRCHDRKVRCSAAFTGIPCTNCAQDGTHCQVYKSDTSVAQVDPLFPVASEQNQSVAPPAYPLTPSPSVPQHAEASQKVDAASTGISNAEDDSHSVHVATTDEQPATSRDTSSGPSTTATSEARHERTTHGLVPYYAGEAEGLEFLFDICSPSRTIKGSPYIISRNVHKRQRFKPEVGALPQFSPAVCRELIRCFFSYVYPVFPVVNAGEFITKYSEDPTSVSSLLLWSVFFAAASFLDAQSVTAAGFKTRKPMKEFCYQHAKAAHDAQLETNKTAIIASTLILSFWYVDLEDLDGTGYWIGIALHLCFTMGLHREPNYSRLPRCPFPASQQALWRRIWWCTYTRDAWFSLGTGRPMRVHIDDCDLQLPTAKDVSDDIKDLPPDLRNVYLPHDLEVMSEVWIRMLQVSIKLDDAMVLHYRPRRPPLSVAQLENDYAETTRLLSSLDVGTVYTSRLLTLHVSHFRCYVNAVIIILYRSYILSTPQHLSDAEKNNLQRIAIQTCKTAAADITNTINKLISEDMIETSPTSLATAIMMGMEIHFYELARSNGLLRQHALHNMNLHLIVYTHLKKTFWTADMHHNLFTECIKALNSGKIPEQKQYAGYAAGAGDQASARSNTPLARGEQSHSIDNVLATSALNDTAFEEFFASFGPFDNFSSLFDESRLEYSNPSNNGLV